MYVHVKLLAVEDCVLCRGAGLRSLEISGHCFRVVCTCVKPLHGNKAQFIDNVMRWEPREEVKKERTGE